MKKETGFIFLVSLVILFSITLVFAESSLDQIGNKADAANNFLSDSNVRSNYLKAEWAKILNNTLPGKVLLAVHTSLQKNATIFYPFIGLNYSFSLNFFLAILIWIWLVVFSLNLSGFLFLSYMTNFQLKKTIRFGLFFVSAVLVSVSGLAAIFSNLFVGIFSSQKDLMVRFFSAIFFVILAIIFFKISKIFKVLSAQVSRANLQKKKDREIEGIKEELKNVKKSKSGSSELDEDAENAKQFLSEFGKEIKGQED
ncbi:hypothetical protein KA107_01470 [Candidatus Pacearchaeota archaeon]|nr:hypothetical protein [Candidatus Pacearchaeota archaeon]